MRERPSSLGAEGGCRSVRVPTTGFVSLNSYVGNAIENIRAVFLVSCASCRREGGGHGGRSWRKDIAYLPADAKRRSGLCERLEARTLHFAHGQLTEVRGMHSSRGLCGASPPAGASFPFLVLIDISNSPITSSRAEPQPTPAQLRISKFIDAWIFDSSGWGYRML